MIKLKVLKNPIRREFNFGPSAYKIKTIPLSSLGSPNYFAISGILDKKKGLFAKRRMFLLTEGPHLYYVDPSAMVLKGEIPWSGELETEIRDFRIFFVKVPDVTSRVYYLIDPESTAKDWCMALEELRDFYYGLRKASRPTDEAETVVSSTTSN